MKAAVAMAAARAEGSVTLDGPSLAALEAAAQRTGRRVITLPGRQAVVGWAVGYEPNLDDDAVEVYELPQTRLIALALCLALCWEPHRGVMASRQAALHEFDAAVTSLVA